MKKILVFTAAAFVFLTQNGFAATDLETKSLYKNFAVWDLMNYDSLRNHNSKKLAQDFFEKADKNSDLLKSDVIRDGSKYSEVEPELFDKNRLDRSKLVPKDNKEPDVNCDKCS